MTIQKVTLDFPSGEDLPAFYCPACGESLQQPEEASELPVCDHVEYRYIDIVGDFDYINDEAQALIDGWEAKAETDDLDYDMYGAVSDLEEKRTDSTKMIIEITTSGMGCGGPMSSTVTYGFKFNSEKL